MALTQISTGGLKDDAVTDAKLPANSVGNSEMKDDAVGVAELAATGTAGNTTYLRGDNTWTVPPDTNTVYTHPNHSGEVTSTADGATVIADDIVDEANLKISNAGSNGQYLQKQSGNTGGLTWADAAAGVGGATGVDFNDDVKIRLGTDNDYEHYHTGSHLYMTNTTGNWYIQPKANETAIEIIPDGKVGIRHNNVEKLGTSSGGIYIDGIIEPLANNTQNIGKTDYRWHDVFIGDDGKLSLGAGDDLQIYHSGSHSYITNATGKILIEAKAGETSIECEPDESVKLYYNNDKKLETLTTGISVLGSLRIGGSAAANEMDDYEEGTFTLTFKAASSDPTTSDVTANARYIKIGDLVWVSWMVNRVDIDNAGSGTARLGGLPFNVHAGDPTPWGIFTHVNDKWPSSAAPVNVYGRTNTDLMQITIYAGGQVNWNVADSYYFGGSLVYQSV